MNIESTSAKVNQLYNLSTLFEQTINDLKNKKELMAEFEAVMEHTLTSICERKTKK